MKFGDINIFLLSDGTFRLDGGAMFGVVPRVLWQRHDPPDEKNRILLGLNSLLIVRGKERILIDCGIGDKFDRKFADIYAIQREHTLLEELARCGFQPEDITHVILSHLHFDHIGWSTRRNERGELRPTFTRAEYFCQRDNYEYGLKPDPRSRASYLQENFVPLAEHGVLKFLEGNSEPLPGIECFVTGGHTVAHSIIKIITPGPTLCFLADLVPTVSHLKTVNVMGYDLFPLQTMQVKTAVLQQAFEEKWLLIFEHGAHVKAGYLQQVEGNWKIETVKIE